MIILIFILMLRGSCEGAQSSIIISSLIISLDILPLN